MYGNADKFGQMSVLVLAEISHKCKIPRCCHTVQQNKMSWTGGVGKYGIWNFESLDDYT